MHKRLVLATLLAAGRRGKDGIADQYQNCMESPVMEPYPGQRCRTCKQKIQVGEIRAIFEWVYSGEVVVDCVCAACGTENAVLMVLSNVAIGQLMAALFGLTPADISFRSNRVVGFAAELE